ncbi:MAG: cytochrome c3 family protein [Desulfobacterales bacterium]|nr:cytochrome c3 family protein [Desulfobacterales bacterium]
MKNRLLLMLIVATSCFFFASGIYAGTAAEDVIKMENKAYSAHKKGIVMFSHKKHAEEYATKNPELYKNGCGECHHDKDGKPLALKAGDEVQSCFECHNKEGEKPKGKDAPKLSKKETLAYHAEAIHANCKGCHKAFNKANTSTAAPVSCNKCHPKKDKG